MKHPEIHAVLDEVLDGGAAYRLPDLPNFGVFYISIPEAANLIVEDLKKNNRRVTFGVYDDADGTPEEREKNFSKGVAALTSELQSRLLHAVRNDKVRSFSKSRTLEDFLQRGDEKHLPKLTFIHYIDLIAWLTQFGYIDRLTFTERPAFEEYERNELDLLEHLEEDVKVRRHLIGKRIQSLTFFIAKLLAGGALVYFLALAAAEALNNFAVQLGVSLAGFILLLRCSFVDQ